MLTLSKATYVVFSPFVVDHLPFLCAFSSYSITSSILRVRNSVFSLFFHYLFFFYRLVTFYLKRMSGWMGIGQFNCYQSKSVLVIDRLAPIAPMTREIREGDCAHLCIGPQEMDWVVAPFSIIQFTMPKGREGVALKNWPIVTH